MAAGEWVKEVSEVDFQTEIVDRSHEVTVLVDFWAAWCGPCRQLGPLLEKLVNEAAGPFVLAKVNVDENQQLASAFRVEGIPAVFAIRNGKVVDHFAGLMPEDQLREFLASLTPSEADSVLATAQEAEATDPPAAERLYQQVLSGDPKNEEARVGLARLLLQNPGREEVAASLVKGIEVGEHQPEAQRLRTILALRGTSHSDEDLNDAKQAVARESESASARHRLGEVLAARGDYEAALAELLAAAERDKALAGGAVRELMVSIFTIVGNRSPLADEYRDKLRSLLY